MEHVAREVKMDPWKVREANMIKPGDKLLAVSLYGNVLPHGEMDEFYPIPEMAKQIQDSSNYKTRRIEIDEFNKVILCPPTFHNAPRIGRE